MTFFKFATVFLAGLLAACHMAKDSNVLTPTDLRVGGAMHDGQQVTVRAWMTLEPEDANLWTDRKDMEDGRTVHCVSLDEYDQLDQRRLNRRRVEVVGIFYRDVVGDTGTVRFAACSRSAIKVISVRRL